MGCTPDYSLERHASEARLLGQYAKSKRTFEVRQVVLFHNHLLARIEWHKVPPPIREDQFSNAGTIMLVICALVFYYP